MNRIAQVESPCPAGFSRLGRTSEVLSDPWDISCDDFENTAAVEFTTEIRAPLLTATRPRRARRGASFKIHEDGKLDGASTADENARPNNALKRKTVDGKSTILNQPAQRFQRPRVSLVVKSAHEPSRTDQKAASRPTKDIISKEEIKPTQDKECKNREVEGDNLKKDVRRRTVYIPPEDTTVPAVFMGLFSPLKSLDPKTNNTLGSEETVPINSLEARIAAKRQARTSLATAPRRGPLQQKSKVSQESTLSRDVAGKNGGKENIPPGYLVNGNKSKDNKEEFPVFEVPAKSTSKKITPKDVLRPKQALSGRENPPTRPENKKPLSKPVGQRSLETMMSGINSKDAGSTCLKSDVKASTVKPKVTPKALSRSSRCSGPITSASSVRENAPTKLSVPKTLSLNIDQKYPLLTDGISNPIMYEDNWLSHQEIVITQLVNGLFDSAGGNLDTTDPEVLRHELLGIYQDNSFVLLYKRLHASLLYGALGVPKDVLARGSRLGEDLGLKRAFLNFWVMTYDLRALRAAAETVMGRRISNSLRLSRNGSGSPDQSLKEQKMLKRTLEAFLDTFLIRNEDREHRGAEWQAGETKDAGWAYRRTILRSILMIVLLDKGRLSPQCSLPRRLFVSSSRYKSSTAALQALGNQLLPSVGDITRPLTHLDCQVSYQQHPLEEYEFQINSLAVDLRDGVLLTRLVELLLYPSVGGSLSGQEDLDKSTGLIMPTGEVLPLACGETDWPLSQHLKVPCSGRATKLFNVQVALSALHGVKGIGVITQDVRPEDIVDGYREKTIALLWCLVGKWGLAGLVDWDDVRKEIVRLRRKISSQFKDACHGNETYEDENSLEDDDGPHAFLLKSWASTLAQLKGLRLDKFTTSFADGRVFESIIEEYETYILGAGYSNSSLTRGTSSGEPQSTRITLEMRLRALGCSSQFGKSDSLAVEGLE
jgi:abnormal spindle-like microcephaly-associated protein